MFEVCFVWWRSVTSVIVTPYFSHHPNRVLNNAEWNLLFYSYLEISKYICMFCFWSLLLVLPVYIEFFYQNLIIFMLADKVWLFPLSASINEGASCSYTAFVCMCLCVCMCMWFTPFSWYGLKCYMCVLCTLYVLYVVCIQACWHVYLHTFVHALARVCVCAPYSLGVLVYISDTGCVYGVCVNIVYNVYILWANRVVQCRSDNFNSILT